MEEQTDITTHTKIAVRLLRMFLEKYKNKNSDILDSVFNSVVSIENIPFLEIEVVICSLHT